MSKNHYGCRVENGLKKCKREGWEESQEMVAVIRERRWWLEESNCSGDGDLRTDWDIFWRWHP